jgi:neutral ceramidase
MKNTQVHLVGALALGIGLVLGGMMFEATAADTGLQAGAAAVNITPPLGTVINGGFRPVLAEQVHDELHARAIVLRSGKDTVAFLVADNCVIPREVFDQAKALIREETGLEGANVMMASTHSHSCGSVQGAYLTPESPEYRARMPRYLADAVRRALRQLAPAEVAHGRGELPGQVFCRRWHLKEGAQAPNPFGGQDLVKMNPGVGHPDLVKPAGPVDPEVQFLAVRHLDGRPLAVLANYSLHYVGGVGGGELSADYFGAFADRIQALLKADRQSPPFVGILSNGTSGDINNINWKGPDQRLKGPYEQIWRVSDELAGEVKRVWEGLEWKKEAQIRVASKELELETRKPSKEEVEKARALIGERPALLLKTPAEIYAREQVLLAEYPDRITMPLTAIRVGDFAVAAWPNEVFASSGLALKAASPVKPLFVMSLGNGWYGYLPPAEQHRLGGYETWRARSSYLEVEAEGKIREAFLEVLGRLK